MDLSPFNYRRQLVLIFHRLDVTVADLYAFGITIGLEEEWPELKEIFEEGDSLPLDIEYLKALEHVSIKGIVRMIEVLAEARQSLQNINQLSEAELELPPELLEEAKESEDFGDYLSNGLTILFGNLLGLFVDLWELAHETKAPGEVCEYFSNRYFEGDLRIDSNDQNVRMVLGALHEVLKINRNNEY